MPITQAHNVPHLNNPTRQPESMKKCIVNGAKRVGRAYNGSHSRGPGAEGPTGMPRKHLNEPVGNIK
jgi:hypothetical protein